MVLKYFEVYQIKQEQTLTTKIGNISDIVIVNVFQKV